MIKKIYLAGGCFWGIEEYYSRLEGVANTLAGYANGTTANPVYKEVCTGTTNFAETVMVEYYSDIISLDDILDHFFGIINPTTLNRQGNDVGTQYRSGIYYVDNEDLPVIDAKIAEVQKRYHCPVVTEVKKLENFYEAEDYHQKYLKKNPNGYCHVDFSKLENK